MVHWGHLNLPVVRFLVLVGHRLHNLYLLEGIGIMPNRS
jgi:hypothetical protein